MKYGRYEILKEIGRGSMGVVYLARDPNIERLVAVKVLRQDRIGNEIFVKRFIKEAKVAGRLSHPNTVTVHDIGEEQGEVYIAMEYLEGKTLSEIVKDKRLDMKEVVDYGVQIAETLDYAHRKGVVHRDIKPSNIVVQPDGRIKITDFGIARIEDSSATLQTQAGETMGTPSYMSPEQVLGQTVDGRSDLFSLGVLLYELSTGKRPFGGEGKTLATVFNEIIQVTPPDPNKASEQVAPELSSLIMKALQKEPGMRFQSGGDLAEALRNCLAEKKEQAEAVTPLPALTDSKKKPPYLIPLLGGVLIAAVACGIFLFSHHGEKAPAENKKMVKGAVQAPQGGKRAVSELPPPGGPVKATPVAPVAGTGAVRPLMPEANKPLQKAVSQPAAQKVGAERTQKTLVAKPPAESAAKKASPALPLKLPVVTQTTQSGTTQALAPKPLPKFAFLKVRTTPKGATVYVDGLNRGTTPLTLKLDLGKYRIKLCRAGYRDMECLVRLDKMTAYPLVKKLQPIN